MNQVKNLDLSIVATDLARGIDIEGVSHVINDIPQDLSFFVHRGRSTAGLPDSDILYQPSDDSDIRELEKMGIKFTPKMIKMTSSRIPTTETVGQSGKEPRS